MSSAILYVAIVVIWACVLIPRWLRRSPSVPASDTGQMSGSSVSSGDVRYDDDVSYDRAPSYGPRHDEAPYDEAPSYEVSYGAAPSARFASAAYPDADYPDAGYPDAGYPESAEFDEAEVPLPDDGDPDEDERPHRVSLSRDESRRRMLAARRRLLILLLALETAACVLPALGLAAVWVVIPPSIMLAGYMLLLREASKADRERAEREAEAEEARARAWARTRARSAAPDAVPAADREPVSPRAEEYEDLGHGRDYAPGLAGKYTTSNAEDFADIPEYKRAVGD